MNSVNSENLLTRAWSLQWIIDIRLSQLWRQLDSYVIARWLRSDVQGISKNKGRSCSERTQQCHSYLSYSVATIWTAIAAVAAVTGLKNVILMSWPILHLVVGLENVLNFNATFFLCSFATSVYTEIPVAVLHFDEYRTLNFNPEDFIFYRWQLLSVPTMEGNNTHSSCRTLIGL